MSCIPFHFFDVACVVVTASGCPAACDGGWDKNSPQCRHFAATARIGSPQNGQSLSRRVGGGGSAIAAGTTPSKSSFGASACGGKGGGAVTVAVAGTLIFVPQATHLPVRPAAASGASITLPQPGHVTRIGIGRFFLLTGAGRGRSNVAARLPIVDRRTGLINQKGVTAGEVRFPDGHHGRSGIGAPKAMGFSPLRSAHARIVRISPPLSAAIGSHATGESGRLAFYRPLLGQEAPLT